jgi:hypothetical protein
MRSELIPISAIFARTGGLLRKIRPEYVKLLKDSIAEIGLQTPISLRVMPCTPGTPYVHNGNHYHVAAGNHRLEACKELGWKEIPAFLLTDLSSADITLWEIDENLMRGDLDGAERAQLLKKRKALFELRHPETKHGGAPANTDVGGKGGKKGKNENSSFLPSFTQDTADKTGLSKRTIEMSIHRADAIAPEVMEAISDMPAIANKGVELDALAAVTPAEQKAAVEAVKSGKARSVREATGKAKKKPKKQFERMKPDEFDRLIQKARETNRQRDQADRAGGFAAPPDCDRESQLRTVVSALVSGIQSMNWNCVAEGLVVLADLADYHPWESRFDGGAAA